MHDVKILLTATTLASLAMCAVPAIADDEVLEDLDETMVVIDNPADLQTEIGKLKKVKDRGVSKEDWQDQEGDTATDEEPESEIQDDHFDNDPEELEDILEVDDDFEDGDEVDDDLASDVY